MNGNLYGVHVAEETTGHAFLRELFPGHSGAICQGGWMAETNETAPNRRRSRHQRA